MIKRFAFRAIKYLYNSTVRTYLPRKIASYNGVAVRRPHLLDKTDVYPQYEGVLVSHIRKYLPHDSEVVIVGGGLGVSTVVAVHSGANNVDTYEASSNRIKMIKETLNLNKVSNKVTSHHTIVESDIEIKGLPGSANQIKAKDLPSCSTLILDCEGAEKVILENLSIYPPLVIVECHPMFGVEANEIVETLKKNSYEIIDKEIEQVVNGEVTIISAELQK